MKDQDCTCIGIKYQDWLQLVVNHERSGLTQTCCEVLSSKARGRLNFPFFTSSITTTMKQSRAATAPRATPMMSAICPAGCVLFSDDGVEGGSLGGSAGGAGGAVGGRRVPWAMMRSGRSERPRPVCTSSAEIPESVALREESAEAMASVAAEDGTVTRMESTTCTSTFAAALTTAGKAESAARVRSCAPNTSEKPLLETEPTIESLSRSCAAT